MVCGTTYGWADNISSQLPLTNADGCSLTCQAVNPELALGPVCISQQVGAATAKCRVQ